MADKFQPYMVRNPASIVGGVFGHLLVAAPTFLGVRVVERVPNIAEHDGVRSRVIPSWQLTMFPRTDENTLQSILMSLKEASLQHGASHEAVELLGLAVPFTKKEYDIMAAKLKEKAAPKAAPKKTTGGKPKGNPEALAKARAAAEGKRTESHARPVKQLVKSKDANLRGGRLAKLAALDSLKAGTTVGDLLGTTVKDETGKEHTIDMGALNGMAKRGHIKIG